MQNIFLFQNFISQGLVIILALSFFTSGCKNFDVATPLTASVEKNEKGSSIPASHEAGTFTGSQAPDKRNIPGTSGKTDASGILLSELKTERASPDKKQLTRNPFAIPLSLQSQHRTDQPITNPELTANMLKAKYNPATETAFNRNRQKANDTLQKSIPEQSELNTKNRFVIYNPDPCLTGVFNNGKERFALLQWQQVKGVFCTGEPLGNGYYVKEITGTTVVLSPDPDKADKKCIIVTIK